MNDNERIVVVQRRKT